MPDELHLVPTQTNEAHSLSVSGPDGYYWQDRFSPGTEPAFSTLKGSALSKAMSALPDGRYTYELRSIPEQDTEVRSAIESDDQEAWEYLRVTGKITPPVVQSGTFLVSAGMIKITAGANEPLAKDIPLLDDTIIDGRLCVGIECVDGEDFDTYADTLRLKQDTLRVHFQDTSSTSSYPTNDWRLLVNDLQDSGAEYFALQDVDADTTPLSISAGAPDSSLFVDAQGKVGLGTATPAGALTIMNPASAAWDIYINRPSGVPGIVLGSASGGAIGCLQSSTVGTLNYSQFSIKVNNEFRLRVFPDHSLEMSNGATCSSDGVWIDDSPKKVRSSSVLSGDEAMQAFDQLRPVKYLADVEGAEQRLGFLADETPQLVMTKDRSGISSMDIAAVLTKVVKEQQATISELAERLAELEARLVSTAGKPAAVPNR